VGSSRKAWARGMQSCKIDVGRIIGLRVGPTM
jgi:hypothetical protein